jgi:hypothetical protein
MWTSVLSQARFQVLLFVVVDTVEGSRPDIEVSVCGPYAVTKGCSLESHFDYFFLSIGMPQIQFLFSNGL